MNESNSAVAKQIAELVLKYHQQTTGHAPKSVSVVLGEDTLVITMHGALTPAERSLAKDSVGASKVQEFHRQLFATSSLSLRQEIERILGRKIREAIAEIEPSTGVIVHAFSTGAVVQVFQLARTAKARV